MIIKVKETVEHEMEIKFPYCTKSDSSYSFNPCEGKSIVIYPVLDSISTYSMSNSGLLDTECTKGEFIIAFESIINNINNSLT
jgi:hypothetical protein